jgi:hypothetical protein
MKYYQKLMALKSVGKKIMWILLISMVGLIILIAGRIMYLKSDIGREKVDPDKAVVRIEMNGRKFNIPLRYMYGETLEKWQQWRSPKTERVVVKSIALDMLLPDLRPYYENDDALWKVLGHGQRVSILLEDRLDIYNTWFDYSLNSIIDSDKDHQGQENNLLGMIEFDGVVGGKDFMSKDEMLSMSCDKPQIGRYPSCRVTANYKDGLRVSYYFGIHHQNNWKKINDGIKSRFDEFEVLAQQELAQKN